MKSKVIYILSLVIAITSFAQETNWKSPSEIPKIYKVDGSLTVQEMTDTTAMKNVLRVSRYLIKKSEDFTYVGIRSNTSTIMNVYLISEDVIKVLHASAEHLAKST